MIDVLNMLRLYNRNYCVVLNPTAQNIGMIKKVIDFITYGEIEEDIKGTH